MGWQRAHGNPPLIELWVDDEGPGVSNPANLFVPFFNVYFVEQLGASTAWFGTLRFLDRTIVVVATLLVAPLAVRYGAVSTITFTQLLSVPCLLAFGFAPGLPLASATFLARGR